MVVKTAWIVKFSFYYLKKKPAAAEEYVFDPEVFLTQAMTKVDWSYDIKVKSCVNERFHDRIREECELNGREYPSVLLWLCFSKQYMIRSA